MAIARALVRELKIILADEPTASLDKKSGRDVVELMPRLAKEHGVTVVLVTHDNRILDIVDRIVQLDDGRATSFSDAVLSNTKHMMSMLAIDNRRGELVRRVADMSDDEFTRLFEQVTEQARKFPDAYRDSRFEPAVDRRSGYRTKSILCVPLVDSESRVFGVAQLLNKVGGEPFDSADEEGFPGVHGLHGIDPRIVVADEPERASRLIRAGTQGSWSRRGLCPEPSDEGRSGVTS